MTDLLLEHKKTGEPGVYALYAGSESEADWEAALTRTGQAMRDKNRAVLGAADDIAAAHRFVGERTGCARRWLHHGRDACRERVCQYVEILVGAESLKKQRKKKSRANTP